MATKKRGQPTLGPGLYWRDGIIYMRSVRQADPFNRSTGTANPQDAQAILVARRAAGPAAEETGIRLKRAAARMAPAPLPEASSLTVEALRDWHLSTLHKRSVGHRKSVEYAWRVGLVPFFTGSDVTRLKPSDLLTYLAFRSDEGEVGGNTIRREIQNLRGALRYHAEHLEMDVRVPPAPGNHEFDLHEIDAARAGSHIEDPHLKALYLDVTEDCRRWMLMLLATGMRQAELRRVERSMLRRAPMLVPSGGLLALPAWVTKTKRARTLALPEWAYQTFVNGPLPFVFNSRNSLHRAGERLRLPPEVFPHDRSLRKTFASRAKEETGDETAVDIASGHKAKGVSGRYQDLTEYRAYAVGRAVTRRFRALLAALDLPHEVWPDHPAWQAEQERRQGEADQALGASCHKM